MKRISLLLIPIAGVFLSACVSLAQDVTPPPGYQPPTAIVPQETAEVYPLLPADPQNGKLIYQQHCADCHGAGGRGNGAQTGSLTSSPDILVDPVQMQNTSPAQFYQIITNGAPQDEMPSFETILDDRERWDVTAYLYMLSSTNDELALGKELFDGVCSECHGALGKGDGVSAKSLPLQPPDFTHQSILSVRSNQDLFQIVTNGSSDVMPSYEKILTEKERLSVIKYLRTLSFGNVVIPTQTATLEQTPVPQTTETAPTAAAEVEAEVTVTAEVTEVDISGKVINDSGTELPVDLTVNLLVFDSMENSQTLQTKAAADGSFSFADVPMQTGRIFITSVTYQGQTFNSTPSFHPQMAGEESEEATPENIVLDIHVSDSTTSIDNLVADRLHIFLDFSQDGIVQVVELWLISNNGGTSVAPADDPAQALKFLLPEGATNLQFQDSVLGERYLPVENGFMDSVTIPPGQSTHQVLYAYDIPYNKKAQLSLPIALNTTSVSVMIPVEGVKLKSDQLLDGGIRGSQEMTYHVFTASNLKINSTLDLIISGLPKSTAAGSSSLPFNPILLGAGVLVLAVTGILYYYFRQKERSKPEAVEGEQSGQDRDAIMDAIIALDDQYKSGKIGEDVYHQRRGELKDQLRKLM